MHKKNILRLFLSASVLLIIALIINLPPAEGRSSYSKNNGKSLFNPSVVHQKINALKTYFAPHPNSEVSGILFTGKIKNGHFELGVNGDMTYKFDTKKNAYKITEFFVDGKINASGTDPVVLPLKNHTDTRSSQKNITRYRLIELQDIYPGISANLQPQPQGIEKIITVQPGADPNQIRLRVKNHMNLSVNQSGELLPGVKNNKSTVPVRFSAPVAFQQIDGATKKVEISYKIIDNNTYGFEIGTYDSAHKLIIDPILYSTFLGGEDSEEYTSESSTADQILIIAEDPADNQKYVYVTGYTQTNGDFPAPFLPEAPASERGSHDIFLVKMPLDLSEITAAALLGGNGSDIYSSITADENGNIYLIYQTTSTDLPTTASSYQQSFGGGSYDVAVMKLPPSLDSITATTYLGGNKADQPGNLAVKNGYVYITGTTSNTGGGNTFPAEPVSGPDEVYNHTAESSGLEIFISRLNTQLDNTYYAGTFIQTGTGLPALTIHSTDANPDNDKIFITGTTGSELQIVDQINAYQPTYGGGINDNFIARLNSKMTSLEASTFIGGSEYSNGAGSITVYHAGESTYRVITANDIISGDTFWSALRTDGENTRHDYDENPLNGVLNACDSDDIYVANFNYNLTSAHVALICGNDSDYHPRAIIDSSGNVYISANTSSSNFPVTDNSYQQHQPGYIDTVLIKLSGNLSQMIAATYLGGTENTDWYAVGLGFDPSENLYVAGQTFSTDFPTTPGTLRPYKYYTDSDFFITGMTNDLTSPCAPLLFNEDTDGEGPISAVSDICLGVRVTPAPVYFENVPTSFSFPPKYAASIAQSSFSKTEIGPEDILTIRDLSGTGSFDVTIQASELTNGFEIIDLSNLYVVSTSPGTANLNTIDPNLNGTTTSEQITYADGSIGQNLIAPVKTTGDIAYPATYLTNGKNFASGPVTVMTGASAEHFLRASQAFSFYLNVPPNTTPGTYSTLFTIDLIQN